MSPDKYLYGRATESSPFILPSSLLAKVRRRRHERCASHRIKSGYKRGPRREERNRVIMRINLKSRKVHHLWNLFPLSSWQSCPPPLPFLSARTMKNHFPALCSASLIHRYEVILQTNNFRPNCCSQSFVPIFFFFFLDTHSQNTYPCDQSSNNFQYFVQSKFNNHER